MTTRFSFYLVILVALTMTLSACGGGGGGGGDGSLSVDNSLPGNMSNDRIDIINDESQLDDRVEPLDEALSLEPVDSQVVAQAGVIQENPDLEFEYPLQFRLIADLDSPVIGETTVQATAVDILQGLAVVSYNTAGNEYRGGVEVVKFDTTEVTSDTVGVAVISQALFKDTDVSGIATEIDREGTGYIYAAEATGDPAFDFPAAYERMSLDRGRLTLSENARTGLDSFACTAIAVDGSYVYAVTGNAGGLNLIDKQSHEVLDYEAADDARWVDIGADRIVVMQGTPGRLSLYSRDEEGGLLFEDQYEPGGAGIPESKSTAQVVNHMAFMAAGPDGMIVLDIDTGEELGRFPVPEVDGVAPEDNVTIAVTVDRDLVFVCNGGGGVYVLRAAKNLQSFEKEETLEWKVLGRIRFNDMSSANHVIFRQRHLFIAGGLGGLKILRVEYHHCGENLLLNGGFEEVDERRGVINNRRLDSLGEGSPTWDVYHGLPDVSYGDGTSWTRGVNTAGIEIEYNGTVVNAYEGAHYVELDAHGQNSNSSMSQSVFMLAGDYTLHFKYRPRTGTVNDNPIRVYFDGELIQIADGTDNSHWVPLSVSLPDVSTDVHTITFSAAGIENSLGGFLDDIELYEDCGEDHQE